MKENDDVILAKLIYSFGYQGFSMNFETLIEVSSSYTLSICFIYGVVWFCKKSKRNILDNKSRNQYSLDPLVIAIAISSFLFIFIFALGRQSTLLALKNKLVPYRISKAHPDQTTSILYPKTKISELLDLMNREFTCDQSKKDGEVQGDVALDLQLASVIDNIYEKEKSMIWIQGNFFNHIGFYTSLHFKNLHQQTKAFISRNLALPDLYCNYP